MNNKNWHLHILDHYYCISSTFGYAMHLKYDGEGQYDLMWSGQSQNPPCLSEKFIHMQQILNISEHFMRATTAQSLISLQEMNTVFNQLRSYLNLPKEPMKMTKQLHKLIAAKPEPQSFIMNLYQSIKNGLISIARFLLCCWCCSHSQKNQKRASL